MENLTEPQENTPPEPYIEEFTTENGTVYLEVYTKAEPL
jgi:hypothetical protein